MKVLLLNGSTRKNGCTYTALSEIASVLNEEGIETETLQMDAHPVRDCAGCGQCAGKGKCIFEDDMVNDWLQKAREADGFVFGSPVYYAHPTGQMLAVLDRMFYAAQRSCRQGAAVRQLLSMCSINTLPSPRCRLSPPPTGTWSMGRPRKRCVRIWRGFRPCGISAEIWHGC